MTTKKGRAKASISHDDATTVELRKDPELAAAYLREILQEGDDPRVILIALRRLAQAHGIAKVAKAAVVLDPEKALQIVDARHRTGFRKVAGAPDQAQIAPLRAKQRLEDKRAVRGLSLHDLLRRGGRFRHPGRGRLNAGLH